MLSELKGAPKETGGKMSTTSTAERLTSSSALTPPTVVWVFGIFALRLVEEIDICFSGHGNSWFDRFGFGFWRFVSFLR